MASTNLRLTIKNYEGNSEASNDGFVGFSQNGTFRTRISFKPDDDLSSVTVTVNLQSRSWISVSADNALKYVVNTTGEMPSRGEGTDWYALPQSESYTSKRDVSFTVTQEFRAGTTYYIWLVGPAGGGYGYARHYSVISAVGQVVDESVARVYHGGSYEKYEAQIYSNGAWAQYEPYVYDNGEWRKME